MDILVSSFLVFLSFTSIQANPIITSFDLIPPQTSFPAPILRSGITPQVIPAPEPSQPLAHHAVVENAIAESQLPDQILNPFYKNPAIANALAKESWFANKEFPVYHREAEKIPRSEIIKLISRIHETSAA